MRCLFVSDLHGSSGRYMQLFQQVDEKKPDAVFIGGDILPFNPFDHEKILEFIDDMLFKKITFARRQLQKDIRFFIILGNDDPRQYEQIFQEAHNDGIIDYVHQTTVNFDTLYVSGYSFIPPTPFQLKDWERYDVSQYVDVGSISPEQGTRTVDVPLHIIRSATIAEDIQNLSENVPVEKTIFLFHVPPYDTLLDRAALDNKSIEYAPFDVHIGSIAIKRFIQNKQPLLTLHGHVHESTTLTGHWKQQLGKTFSFNAAYEGIDLALIQFDTTSIKDATRTIIPIT
ncbi:MAG: metallophosphoesterase [Thermoplasmatota archaeon]